MQLIQGRTAPPTHASAVLFPPCTYALRMYGPVHVRKCTALCYTSYTHIHTRERAPWLDITTSSVGVGIYLTYLGTIRSNVERARDHVE